MTNFSEFLLFASCAYLFGSIPFGKFAGKAYGIDIQKQGSGNIGFANVLRELGWKAGYSVLVGDVLKGFVPVFIAKQFVTTQQVLWIALIAILGHIFPVWLKFKGGKGVATGLGVTLAISPWLALLGLLAYLVTIAIVRKSAPSSIVACWILPMYAWAILPSYLWFYLTLAILGTWTHRDNIRNLVSSKQSKRGVNA